MTSKPDRKIDREQPRRQNTTSRLHDTLRNRIESGEWRIGERIPSEPALARDLGVSRGSLRGALAALESEGVIVRRHGSGTFVNTPPPLRNSLHLNTSADQMIASTGRSPGTSELVWRRMVANADISERLALVEGAEVFELYRIRTADGLPVTVSFDYLPAGLVPGQPALLGPSLYSFLESVCGIVIAYGVAELSPVAASADIAVALDVTPGTLCLLMHQVDFDSQERPCSYSVEYHLASAYSFELLRRGPSGLALLQTARQGDKR